MSKSNMTLEESLAWLDKEISGFGTVDLENAPDYFDDFRDNWKAIRAQLLAGREAVKKMEQALGCFTAAYSEGLEIRLQEQDDQDAGSLYGLYKRRILYASHYLEEALTSAKEARISYE